jgi:hypothetical protein
VAIVPWFYNVFKKHPLTTFMLHRVPRTKEERDLLESEGLEDPFLPDEEDPMETHAIDSCIWEIVQLQTHYHPNVATIAKIVSEQFTKQSYGLEDFLDHSYSSVSVFITVSLSHTLTASFTALGGRDVQRGQETTSCGVHDSQKDLHQIGFLGWRARQSAHQSLGFRVFVIPS